MASRHHGEPASHRGLGGLNGGTGVDLKRPSWRVLPPLDLGRALGGDVGHPPPSRDAKVRCHRLLCVMHCRRLWSWAPRSAWWPCQPTPRSVSETVVCRGKLSMPWGVRGVPNGASMQPEPYPHLYCTLLLVFWGMGSRPSCFAPPPPNTHAHTHWRLTRQWFHTRWGRGGGGRGCPLGGASLGTTLQRYDCVQGVLSAQGAPVWGPPIRASALRCL